MRKVGRFLLLGEDEVFVDYSSNLQFLLDTVGVTSREWDIEENADATRDTDQQDTVRNLKFLVPVFQDFTSDCSVYDLLRELREFGRPATLREVIAPLEQSDVMKWGFQKVANMDPRFSIQSLPAAGLLLDDGRVVPSIILHAPMAKWGLIPMTTESPVSLFIKVMYVVVA